LPIHSSKMAEENTDLILERNGIHKGLMKFLNWFEVMHLRETTKKYGSPEKSGETRQEILGYVGRIAKLKSDSMRGTSEIHPSEFENIHPITAYQELVKYFKEKETQE